MIDDPDFQARMTAMSDQLEAYSRDRRVAIRKEWEEGPTGDEAKEPVALWEEGGVWCAILRGPMGTLCGYARVPDGHPWAGLFEDDPAPGSKLDREQPAEQAVDDYGVIPIFLAAACGEERLEEFEGSLAARVQVHGGITWTGSMPIAGAPHGWWLGFDCNHSSDAPPREHAPDFYFEHPILLEGHVWTVEEVTLEIKRMVTAITEAVVGE